MKYQRKNYFIKSTMQSDRSKVMKEKTRAGNLFLAISIMIFFSCALHAAEKKDNFLQKYNESIIDITKKNIPVVVNISAIKEMPKNEMHEYDMFGNPLRKYPFKMPVEPKALGSGVIIDKRGYIVTNNHVVKDTRMIKVTLSDRREFSCQILGSDPATDIAIIKIEGKVPDDLPVVDLADSETIRVGELAIAIGNPFGFAHTVTTGIISATGRQSVGLADYENYIQTDAAINPGNSGGALININGKMIGINTAIFSKSGGYMGIGFAIPSNMIKEVANDLISKGKVVRGWLGVYIQDVSKDIAESFKYEKDKGVLVSDIVKGSPAEGTSIKRGDIITNVDTTPINDVNHLRRVVAIKKPGSKAKISIFRDGKTIEIAMTVGTLPDKPVATDMEPVEKEDTLGMVIKDIDEEISYKYRTADKTGVAVTQVKQNSPAAAAGIIVGDVIKEIERNPIENSRDYFRILSNLKGKKKLLLLITRGGTYRFTIVDMEAR